MFRETLHSSIDIGTTKVCTLVAVLHATGTLEIIGSGVVPSRGMKKGMVVNIEEVQQVVRASLEEATRSAGVTIPWAYLSVGGPYLETSTRWGSIRSTHYSLPISEDDVDRAAGAAYPADVPPERTVLHLLPKAYTLDGLRGIRNPVGMHALHLDVETICVTAGSTPLQNLVRAVERNRVKVLRPVASPLSAGEAILGRDEREIGVLVIELGGGTTTVAHYQQGALWNTALLPLGGAQFTTDLALTFNLPYEAAEELKLQHGTAEEVLTSETVEVTGFGRDAPLRVERRQLARVLRQRATEVLKLAYLTGRDALGLSAMPPAGVVLTGGAATMPGMDTLARSMFGAPVRIAAPRGIQGLPDPLKGPAYATSVGVLQWGIHNHISTGHAGKTMANGDGMTLKEHYAVAVDWLRERVKRVAL
ncbi:MAG: cell division protein FtsA [Chloroflexi bacterium]|nr:cell division protein FtsA [Chloroflexota bacterium]